MKSGTVNDSADILARCVSTTLAGGLRASTSGLDSGMAGPTCDFGGIAFQSVVTGNGLSSPVTADSLREPSWLVEMCTDSVAVDDSADILAASDGTTPTGNFVRPRLA